MNFQTVFAFIDEFEKIANEGAALGAELLGIPGAIYGGYKTGGPKTMVGTGAGIAGGLGAGLGARHLIRKYITSGEFGKRHPLTSVALEALPLAIGTTVGGALGEHITRSR